MGKLDGKVAVITVGSIAIHLPHIDTIITGDVAITEPGTGLQPGPLNADNACARSRFDHLLALECGTIAVGHGRPTGRA